MAKAKKKELTLEEKLEEALVPESEQPYKVPNNWVWFPSLFVFNITYGKGLSKKQLIDKGYPVFGANGYIGYYSEYLSEKPIALMSCRGAYSGTINITVEKTFITNNSLLLQPKTDQMSAQFTALLFKSQDCTSLISGSAQPQITVQAFSKFNIPLPPLAEQKRIVDRIERLFSKLDRAKDLLEAAIDSFESRKAAILHKAFTGELTAKWREENGVSFDSWEEKDFIQVAKIKSNLVQPDIYPRYPHIAPDNIQKKTGKLLSYKTVEEDKVISGKHRFYKGQILYSKIRPYLSKVVLINFDGLCSADMYPIEAKDNHKYLWYYMLSEFFLEQASSAGSRTVLPKINQKELNKLKVVIPKTEEQEEIVRILDSLLEKENKAKELYDAIEQIELLKKSILARAFRGELGTNNPEEESARELLKEVL